MKKYLISLLSIFLLLVFLSIKAEAQKFELALDFKLQDLNQNTFTLSNYKDKQPVILFFWTTWCPFCRGELKTLNDNYHRLLKDGIQLLAIDIGEAAGRVENFVKKQGIFFNILLDKDTKVAYSYNLLGVPTYILVDKKGQIIFKGNSFPQEYKKLLTQ